MLAHILVLFFSCSCWIVNIDADRGLFEYGIEIQHQKSWQEMSLVMQHKGNLHEYCTQLRVKMGIAFIAAHSSVDVSMFGHYCTF